MEGRLFDGMEESMWNNVVILFREYMGTGVTVIWFVLSLVYLWVNEKEQHIRILFLYMPIILLLLYFNPLFAMLLYGIIGEEIYYRLLWMLPVTMVIGYTCVSICGRIVDTHQAPQSGTKSGMQNTAQGGMQNKPQSGTKSGMQNTVQGGMQGGTQGAGGQAGREQALEGRFQAWKFGFKRYLSGGMAAIAMAGTVVVCGSYIYHDVNFVRAQNIYHVPDCVVSICDTIHVPGREVMAVFPPELVQYVRQYSAYVCMPYGREILVERLGWGYESPLFDAMKLEEIDLEQLVQLSREEGCHFCILRKDKKMTGDPEDYGWVQAGEADGYVIYRDTAVELIIPEAE